MNKAIIEGAVYACSDYSVVLVRENMGFFREIIERGAITNSIKRRRVSKLNLNHAETVADSSDLEVWETYRGLAFRARISNPQIVAQILHGVIKGCSFSFWTIKESLTDFIPEHPVRIRTIKSLDIYEISILNINPAYPSEVKVISVPDAMMLDVYKARLELLRGE